MHPRIKKRIEENVRAKQSEIDADLKGAIADISEIFTSFPMLGFEAQEFSEQLKRISELIDSTDPRTERGINIRSAAIELLRRVNPRLEILGNKLSELSKYFSEFRIELLHALSNDSD